MQSHLDDNDHINKGENDGEDLSNFKEETIASKLRAKIHDSSVTIVMISKNMKDVYLPETDQWIPWEISYSLKEITRNDRTSSTNAMLAVVLPDENGRYDYFIETIGCIHCNSIKWKTDSLFNILGKNMFNKKQPNVNQCPSGTCGLVHRGNDHSYIYPVRWDSFISNVNFHIDHAISINQNINEYELTKMSLV